MAVGDTGGTGATAGTGLNGLVLPVDHQSAIAETVRGKLQPLFGQQLGRKGMADSVPGPRSGSGRIPQGEMRKSRKWASIVSTAAGAIAAPMLKGSVMPMSTTRPMVAAVTPGPVSPGDDHGGAGSGHGPLGRGRLLGAVFRRIAELLFGGAVVAGGGRQHPVGITRRIPSERPGRAPPSRWSRPRTGRDREWPGSGRRNCW